MEKIETIKELLKQRRTLEARKLLDELKDIINRKEELEEFSIEVKRLARNTGRSRSIDVGELEELFVKYRIHL